MKLTARVFCFATLAAFALAGAGCEKIFQKDSERTISAGDKKAAAGDFRVAIKMYEAALDGTARTAEVHYKIGAIYDEKLHATIDALHHFNRYLELAPDGSHAKEAKAYQKDAPLKLAETLNRGSLITQEEAVRIKKENLDLRMQLVKLKGQRSTPVPGAAPAGKSEFVQKPIPPGARTYTVQKGDTLGSIAMKFYKSKARWMQIRDANFQGAKGTPPIKAGQVLLIP